MLTRVRHSEDALTKLGEMAVTSVALSMLAASILKRANTVNGAPAAAPATLKIKTSRNNALALAWPDALGLGAE